jgi:hypothetical protein
MSAHGGSNSWNLSPSALTSPGWELGQIGRLNAQDRRRRQKAASGPLWPACGRPGPEVVKRPSFCLWRGSAA